MLKYFHKEPFYGGQLRVDFPPFLAALCLSHVLFGTEDLTVLGLSSISLFSVMSEQTSI